METNDQRGMFRLAENAELYPHTREDREQLPHMLYVAFSVKRGPFDLQVGYRFIFAAHPVTTPRSILDLEAWMTQHVAGSSPLMVLSSQPVEEELL